MAKSVKSKVVALLVGVACVLTGISVPVAANAAVEAVLVVSPTGSGTACSATEPCSLPTAQDLVRDMTRGMTGDIEVQLRGGTYQLASAFVLTAEDSGRDDHRVVYRAFPDEAPVLSGGVPITGWTLSDATRNIYRASVPSDFDTRQLYVDDERAVRARGPLNPSGFTRTSSGFSTTDTTLQNWGNPTDVEVVDRHEWVSVRCGVQSISSSLVTVDPICWERARRHPDANMEEVEWLENAYELLDAEGEWYLDTAADYVYYKPRTGEDLATASVVAGSTESLLEITGSVGEPVRNITVEGLAFAHTSWLRPNGENGYPTLQSGFQYYTPVFSRTEESLDLLKTPAAVTVTSGHSVILERNTFTHLGAAGVNFEAGTKDSVIRGSRFTDISSSAIQVGHMNDSHPSDPRRIVKDNAVSNNVIWNVGAEYEDAVGIYVGLTKGTSVHHNELFDLPYTGISVGWGWGCIDAGGACGFSTPSVSKSNDIAYNHVENVMTVLRDGGGVYTLGAQAGTTVRNNYVRNAEQGIGLYPDQGSRYMTWENNVVAQTPRWLHIHIANIQDLLIRHNYSDNANKYINGTNITLIDNQERLSAWPEAAQAIIDESGLESGYEDIRPVLPVNVALTATPTASSTLNATYGPAKAIDGSIVGGWSPLGTDSRPWLQLDLGDAHDIDSVEFVSRQDLDQPATRRNFEVRASNDPTFATSTLLGSQGSTPFAHRATWSQPVWSAIPFRYVRITKAVDGEYLFVPELRVLGIPVPTENFAADSTASASSAYSVFGPQNAVDGSTSTGWSPLASTVDPYPWLQLDLGSSREIQRVEFVARQDLDQPTTRASFEVRASNDPSFATYAVLGAQGTDPFPHAGTWSATIAAPEPYRYVRVAKTANDYLFVAELRAIG